MKKRFLTILFACCAMLMCFGGAAMAVGTDTAVVKVAFNDAQGQTICKELYAGTAAYYKNDGTEGSVDACNVAWDGADTLTLDGYTYTGDGFAHPLPYGDDESQTATIYCGIATMPDFDGPLNIEVKGSNSISIDHKGSDTLQVCGIFANGGVKKVDMPEYIFYLYGEPEEGNFDMGLNITGDADATLAVTVDSTAVDEDGEPSNQNVAIYADRDLTIDGPALDLSAGNASTAANINLAIDAGNSIGAITFKDCTIDAVTGKADVSSSGLFCNTHTITVDDCSITAEAAESGMSCYGLSITTSSFTAKGSIFNLSAGPATKGISISEGIYIENGHEEDLPVTFTDCDITVTASMDADSTIACDIEKANITFTDCTINAQVRDEDDPHTKSRASGGICLNAEHTIFKNCDVTACANIACGEHGSSYGIKNAMAEWDENDKLVYMPAELTFEGGTVHATAKTGIEYSGAIKSTGNLTLKGARVTALNYEDPENVTEACFGIDTNTATIADCPEVFAVGGSNCLHVTAADAFTQGYTQPGYIFDLGNDYTAPQGDNVLDRDVIGNLTTARGKFYMPEFTMEVHSLYYDANPNTTGSQTTSEAPEHYAFLHIYKGTLPNDNVKTGIDGNGALAAAIAAVMVLTAVGILAGKKRVS